MYQNKYLKYKNKYINLKNQGVPLYNLIKRGGSAEFDTLASQCLSQISTNDNTCISCKFFHGNDSLSSSHTKKMCTQQDIPVYFFKHNEDSIELISRFLSKPINNIDELQLFVLEDFDIIEDIAIIANSFLKPSLYHNVSSYSVIPNSDLGNQIIIQQYDHVVNTFCAEGNIVWVNGNSKVGTTGVTSCLFMILFLDDHSILCIHHTVGDDIDNGLDAGWGFQKNYTHKTYLSQILNQVNGRVKQAIKIGNAQFFPNILNIYETCGINIVTSFNDGHYIIDNEVNNQKILILKIMN